jgi:hypothetical protein
MAKPPRVSRYPPSLGVRSGSLLRHGTELARWAKAGEKNTP